VTTACGPKTLALISYLQDFMRRAEAKQHLQQQHLQQQHLQQQHLQQQQPQQDQQQQQEQEEGSAQGTPVHPRCHGIVFARERATVLTLVQVLQSCPELRDFVVVPFMGSGSKSASCRHRGMTHNRQIEALQRFKQAGRWGCGMGWGAGLRAQGATRLQCSAV